MKEKIYTSFTTAIDKKGDAHQVVIVGVYNQKKTSRLVEREVIVPVNENKNVDGILVYDKPEMKRTLKYAFAICHPDDKFNLEIGKKIATKRAKKSPMGMLETTLITSLCKDQIKLILDGELQYIVKNIDKFLENK